ncbi:MAG: ribonuclease III [gamma proteobacterium symbiont of Bathyaustriella thionipta]|nr:ribonuclease III [gamma proteobacterium symbiont of Bathyaustriella thionipta]MCU7949878.1 ribonuclease III [gamma proteobacterium symbiont of Bathyaustriella thionipta]MCU7952120.1 ribonuclease III [gamma proteobacterium symbiont of Bathyaustriella thionipta]MCU7956460.1 ribonuclease III [gamma proteobacterium symbiont of Bathyaustriella thionipta]MCU7968772.1 ribonuclease III [gamma proteobacterium symbiont of Bathyaustriella thionipta]
MNTNLNSLCNKLGYTFHNLSLLEIALSHRSIGKNNNERMEFLGDSVIGYVMAEELYIRFGDENEGNLSRYRSLLVKGDTLASIARQFGVGQYLKLGGGELKSGGFRRASILADAMEAIIGAITLDSGIEQARICILSWYKDRLDNIKSLDLKDPKTRLQEYLQAQKLDLPQYNVISINGKEHAQIFQVDCHVKELNLSITSEGNSRRATEQKSAELMLEKIQLKQ